MNCTFIHRARLADVLQMYALLLPTRPPPHTLVATHATRAAQCWCSQRHSHPPVCFPSLALIINSHSLAHSLVFEHNSHTTHSHVSKTRVRSGGRTTVATRLGHRHVHLPRLPILERGRERHLALLSRRCKVSASTPCVFIPHSFVAAI